MEYEAMELIEVMYATVAEAKPMPLAAGRCIVERNDLLSMLEELRDNLPREMEEARRLWEAKEEFIASAKREAEQIRKAAEEQAEAPKSKKPALPKGEKKEKAPKQPKVKKEKAPKAPKPKKEAKPVRNVPKTLTALLWTM